MQLFHTKYDSIKNSWCGFLSAAYIHQHVRPCLASDKPTSRRRQYWRKQQVFSSTKASAITVASFFIGRKNCDGNKIGHGHLPAETCVSSPSHPHGLDRRYAHWHPAHAHRRGCWKYPLQPSNHGLQAHVTVTDVAPHAALHDRCRHRLSA